MTRDRFYNGIAVVFMAGVTIVDHACSIWLNLIDRGGKTGRDSHYPLNKDDQ